MRCLLWISLLCLTLCAQAAGPAGVTLPLGQGQRARYTLGIHTPKATISGLCLLVADSTTVRGSVVNEFGVKAFDLVYVPATRKVRLLYLMPMLDKWYIRKVLGTDLGILLSGEVPRRGARRRVVQADTCHHVLTLYNNRHHITYQLKPLYDDATE